MGHLVLEVAGDVEILLAGRCIVVEDMLGARCVEERRLVRHKLADASIAEQVADAVVRVGQPEVDTWVLLGHLAVLDQILVVRSLDLRGYFLHGERVRFREGIVIALGIRV